MNIVKSKVLESSVLFVSILKWLLLASCVGIIVGMSTTVFLKLLGTSVAHAADFRSYFLLLPVALF